MGVPLPSGGLLEIVPACQGTKGDKNNSRNHFVVITGAKIWGIFQVHLIRILYGHLIRIRSIGYWAVRQLGSYFKRGYYLRINSLLYI